MCRGSRPHAGGLAGLAVCHAVADAEEQPARRAVLGLEHPALSPVTCPVVMATHCSGIPASLCVLLEWLLIVLTLSLTKLMLYACTEMHWRLGTGVRGRRVELLFIIVFVRS